MPCMSIMSIMLSWDTLLATYSKAFLSPPKPVTWVKTFHFFASPLNVVGLGGVLKQFQNHPVNCLAQHLRFKSNNFCCASSEEGPFFGRKVARDICSSFALLGLCPYTIRSRLWRPCVLLAFWSSLPFSRVFKTQYAERTWYKGI